MPMDMSPDQPPALPQVTSPSGVSQRQRMAVAALVLGILSLVPGIVCPPVSLVLAMIGLILGIIALVRSNSDPARFGGGGKALAGIITSGVGIFMIPVMVTILLPSLARARELAKRAVDSANMRAVGQAALVYSHANGGAAAPDLQALVTAKLVSPNQLLDVASGHTPPVCDYDYVAYSPAAAGKVKTDWILLYSDPKFHHGEGANVLFVDGHVEFIREPEFSRRLTQFRREYQDAFGRPPEIVPRSAQAP